MRGYIFTETERKLLRKWIKTGEEPKTLTVLFSKMRRTKPTLMEDIKLYLNTRKRLVAQHRWRLNVPHNLITQHLEELASTPTRREEHT